METTITPEAILKLVKQLSLVDKIRLVKQIASQVETELIEIESTDNL
ncbi:MAG: hypothetical protein AAF757_32485 [Cyanobacteria bacterium P01_D01_bin.116]